MRRCTIIIFESFIFGYPHAFVLLTTPCQSFKSHPCDPDQIWFKMSSYRNYYKFTSIINLNVSNSLFPGLKWRWESNGKGNQLCDWPKRLWGDCSRGSRAHWILGVAWRESSLCEFQEVTVTQILSKFLQMSSVSVAAKVTHLFTIDYSRHC